MNILIVEDSEKVRESLVKLIKLIYGACDIVESDNIAKAKSLIPHKEFEIAILDLNLPDGSGIELISSLKSSNCKNIVIFSNTTSDYIRTKCSNLGADHIFDKTSEFEELIALLEDLQPTL